MDGQISEVAASSAFVFAVVRDEDARRVELILAADTSPDEALRIKQRAVGAATGSGLTVRLQAALGKAVSIECGAMGRTDHGRGRRPGPQAERRHGPEQR